MSDYRKKRDKQILAWIMGDTCTFDTSNPISIDLDKLADELVDADIEVVKDHFSKDAWAAMKNSVKELQEEWKCKGCLVAKHTNMIV